MKPPAISHRPTKTRSPLPWGSIATVAILALLLGAYGYVHHWMWPASQNIRAIDGDTLEIGETTYRLWGIDAPEGLQRCGLIDDAYGLGWSCGSEASVALGKIIGARDVDCDAIEQDRYHRTVAKCYAGGEDLGRAMVRAGWAFDWPRYSGGFYAADQDHARDNHLGMWREDAAFVFPWDYRQGLTDACKVDIQAGTVRELTEEELLRFCPGSVLAE